MGKRGKNPRIGEGDLDFVRGDKGDRGKLGNATAHGVLFCRGNRRKKKKNKSRHGWVLGKVKRVKSRGENPLRIARRFFGFPWLLGEKKKKCKKENQRV